MPGQEEPESHIESYVRDEPAKRELKAASNKSLTQSSGDVLTVPGGLGSIWKDYIGVFSEPPLLWLL